MAAVLGVVACGGQPYGSVTGGRLPFTFVGILIGSVLFNFPFAVRPFAAAFATVDRRLAGLETPNEGAVNFVGETWFEAGLVYYQGVAGCGNSLFSDLGNRITKCAPPCGLFATST